nr:ProQ/FINO family protein [Salinicola sp. S1-1-2]
MVVNRPDHNEDPDGGSRTRGLGNLAFRRPRAKEGSEALRHGLSPLQRLTSPADDSPSAASETTEPLSATEVSHSDSQASRGESSTADPEATATGSEASLDLPPAPADDALAAGQSSLAFGAEHEAPSPHALLAQWYKRYPQTFFKGHTRPLKTGIHLDLCEREPWPEKLVRRALACYVHLPRYLKSVREASTRVDLDGGDSDVVTAEEAKHAKRQLEALQKKQKAREIQQRSEKLDRKIGALLAKHGQPSRD